MALPVPNLDDRTFQEIVNEARRRIPQYCPEWTDHNLSDPGITLVELFSWMTELTLYRLNKVPDKNFVKFLELIGVSLTPAAPASTEVTFRLSAPQSNPVTVPRGTEVATVRTETDDAILFTTTEDLTIYPANLEHFRVSWSETQFDDRLPILRSWANRPLSQNEEPPSLAVFKDTPEINDAFYLGFASDIRRTVLSVDLDFTHVGAPGISPIDPPLAWEYWDSEEQNWCEFHRDPDSDAWLEQDGTLGLNTRGELLLHIPRTASELDIQDIRAYWIRCRVVPSRPNTGAYYVSPRIQSVIVADAIGGTAMSRNATSTMGEVLGISDGTAGQSFAVSQTPMLPLEESETVEVQREDNTGWDAWQRVEDFSKSGPDDKHFICDPVAGEISFGPVIRSPNGQEQRYGAVPPSEMRIRLTSYRSGGGPSGNVGRNTLTVLKSSIPYIDSTTNRRLASGGVDPENIEHAKMRGPESLRTRNRAVTEEDFEHLAREASPSVRRARCLQPREVGTEGDPLPGVVRVLLVPTLPSGIERTVLPEHLRLRDELVSQVREYLDERRMLTTVLVVSEPEYTWVDIEAKVRARQGVDLERLKNAVESKLFEFVHPITGGADGNGWPFGRSLFASELYSQIQPIPGVEYVEQVLVYPVRRVDSTTWERGEPTQTLHIPRAGLLCSRDHTVECSSQG